MLSSLTLESVDKNVPLEYKRWKMWQRLGDGNQLSLSNKQLFIVCVIIHSNEHDFVRIVFARVFAQQKVNISLADAEQEKKKQKKEQNSSTFFNWQTATFAHSQRQIRMSICMTTTYSGTILMCLPSFCVQFHRFDESPSGRKQFHIPVVSVAVRSVFSTLLSHFCSFAQFQKVFSERGESKWFSLSI